MSTFLIFILSLSLCSVKSKDICFLSPDGKYEGITVYKYYSSFERFQYLAVNKRELEYELELKVAQRVVKIRNGAASVADPEFVHRIGIHYSLIRNKSDIDICLNCWTKKSEITELECLGEFQTNQPFNTSSKGTFNFLTYDSILFRPFTTRVTKAYFIAVLNKKTREIKYISFGKGRPKEMDSCEECNNHSFINELNDNLIGNLESIVDFKVSDGKSRHGFVLFFNIEGQPMYCFQTANKKSSYCSKPKNMKKLKDVCFPGLTNVESTHESTYKSTLQSTYLITNSPSPQMTNTESMHMKSTISSTEAARGELIDGVSISPSPEPTNSRFWYIFILVLVILVLVVIIFGFILYIMPQKEGKVQKDDLKKDDTKVDSEMNPKESSEVPEEKVVNEKEVPNIPSNENLETNTINESDLNDDVVNIRSEL